MRRLKLALAAVAALTAASPHVAAQTGAGPSSQGNQAFRLAQPQPVQPPPAPRAPITPEPVQPAPAPQAPLEPQPVQPPPTLPPPTSPAPTQPQTAPQAAPSPQQQTGAPNPNATLAGRPGDPSDVDEIELVAKPVLILPGQSSWDQGFQRLSESFRILREEAAKAKLAIAGRPLTLFVETDDNGFRFEAMLPVERAPDPAAALANGVRPGTTPAGPSLRFVHTAPYDDIDSTYETITAFLEAKSIAVKDAFLEEYVSDLKDPLDPNLEINVYVQPR